ncbi:signal recognition particle-docking protein FtsY [Aeromonas enteropelogenes]|uniref:signal recognition particle-docking protein FtsY n=1 Tax=Aeromonas enteropelogenes TaxID=29489 RepID=UPI0005A923F1|nr:signal recognition particle-docking protein FtsY [Aeromonas enteropelogenes]UBH53781.1 signal recognition particle-docking protein FtsY [Aeromonas enteropelogenes]
MAKGLFSWLGFGRKKEEAEAVQPQTPQATPVTAEPEVPATPAADTVPAVSPEVPTSEPSSAGHDECCQPAEPDAKGPLVVEECASDLEPVIVNESLMTDEARAAEEARIAAEAKAAEEARIAAEAKTAEEARIAAEAKAAEEARIAAEAKAAEEARIAAEAKAAEEARIGAEAQAAEEARIAAEAQAAEEARIAAEAKAAEAQAAEEARIAAEAQAAEEARIAAEAKAAEEARIAAEAQAAEEARIAAEAEAAALATLPLAAAVEDDTQEKPQREGFFARLKRSLVRTKENIGSGFFGLFRGKKIDDDLFEELETQLLTADLGVDTTTRIIEGLVQHADRKQLKDAEALYGLLKQDMGAMLAKVEQPLVIDTGKKPYVILMVGVNGVGKTTTIGKLAKQFQAEGKSVMLAAGDTFRAAAVEQLQVWGQRNNIPVIAQHTGADSASVIFDAIEAARSRGADVLIADTAGRLQNKSNLMEELKKVVRVMKKLDEEAPHEIMLTLDAGTGQNALSQAKLFSEAVGLTGITLTKLDGTAKGGVIFAVADKFQIPIRYIGVGEGIDDLRPFVANDFIEALFSRDE